MKSDLQITPSPFLNQCILKSWWVILFFIISFFIYDQSSSRQRDQKNTLVTKLEQLVDQKGKALLRQKELLLQIESQNDPEYIEMVLMRRLGLVREGQTKVVFQHT